MSVYSGFFNSSNHDRKYDAMDISRLFDGLIRDGIFASIGGCFVCTADGKTMTIKVASGRAWFNHTWTYNDNILPVTLSPSEILYHRTDAIVLEVNAEEKTRANTIKIVKGAASGQAWQRPALVNTAQVHQYPLCYVHLAPAVTSIGTADVENKVGTDATPFVSGILEVISIDKLIPQWKAILDNFVTTNTNNFNTWMNGEKQTYNKWLTDSKNAYNSMTADQKKTFDNMIASQKSTFNTNETNRTNSFNSQMSSQKSTFETNTKNQQATFDKALSDAKNSYNTWYNSIKNTYNQWFATIKAAYDTNWSQFQQWETNSKKEFETWYAGIKAELDENIAGNLQNAVKRLETEKVSLIQLKNGYAADTVDGCLLVGNAFKNLLKATGIQTSPINGVTATVNSNGFITLNGTATANCTFIIKTNLSRDDILNMKGKYHLYGCPVNKNCYLELYTWDENWSNDYAARDYGAGVWYVYAPDRANFRFQIHCDNGATFDNVVIKPTFCNSDYSLRNSNDTFIPNSGFTVLTTGKNILRYPYLGLAPEGKTTTGGLTFDYTTEGIVKITGTNTITYPNIWLTNNSRFDTIVRSLPDDATININFTSNQNKLYAYISLFTQDGKYVKNTTTMSVSEYKTKNYKGTILVQYDWNTTGNTANGTCSGIMLYVDGHGDKTFEKYKSSILTITPNTKLPDLSLKTFAGGTHLLTPANVTAFYTNSDNGKYLLDSIKKASESSKVTATNDGSQPSNPEMGDIWFDVKKNVPYYYTGSAWARIDDIPYTNTTAPSSTDKTKLWYNPSTQVLSIYVNAGGAWGSPGWYKVGGGGVSILPIASADSAKNNFNIDPNTGIAYYYYNGSWRKVTSVWS